MKNEMMDNTIMGYDDNANVPQREKIDLPIIEFGADEAAIEQTLVNTIEQIPLDEQERYWQVMDSEDLDINEKLNLVNDLIRKYNGDMQE